MTKAKKSTKKEVKKPVKILSDVYLPPFKVVRVVSTLSQVKDWGITKLNVPNTWSITQGEGVVGMVIDTGYTNHSDLEGAMLIEKCKSLIDYETDKTDINGHSTHCCGIIGARNNDEGMVGVAPMCNLITCKVLDKDGSGSFENIVAALEYAKQIKPDFISMSLGSSVGDENIHKAIKDLKDMNIPVIAAAGNDGRTNSVNYPGKYPETICVAAIDQDGNIANFSSRGDEVLISAPGVSIYSTWLGNSYAKLSGTSMATPFISGVVALLIAKHRKQEKETGMNDCKTVDQIKEHLIKYVDDKGAVGRDSNYGYGIVNPEKTINEKAIIEKPTPPAISPTTPKIPWYKRFWGWLTGN